MHLSMSLGIDNRIYNSDMLINIKYTQQNTFTDLRKQFIEAEIAYTD